jgi:predicted nicotinamide N-methyase
VSVSRRPRRAQQDPAPAALRAFVRAHTQPRELPDLPGIRIRRGGADIMELFEQTRAATGSADPPLPYWAYAWSGGLGLARHLAARRELVRGRHVLDVASGSGLCAIVAMRQGARRATAIDVDSLAAAAIAVNAHVNGVAVEVVTGDLLEQPVEGWDMVLAGDVCYEEVMAARLMDWLRRAAAVGATVLVGDPGRRYLPAGLFEVASYTVHTSLDIEESELKQARVFAVAQ